MYTPSQIHRHPTLVGNRPVPPKSYNQLQIVMQYPSFILAKCALLWSRVECPCRL